MADARQRRIHHDPARDASRILRGERIADHVADIVGDEIGLSIFERVEHPRHIARLRLLVVAARRDATRGPCRADRARSTVWSLDQSRGQRRPHVAGIAEAVEHQHRGPASAERTWMVASPTETSRVTKPAGNGLISVRPDVVMIGAFFAACFVTKGVALVPGARCLPPATPCYR